MVLSLNSKAIGECFYNSATSIIAPKIAVEIFLGKFNYKFAEPFYQAELISTNKNDLSHDFETFLRQIHNVINFSG